ncbi:MotE family protein [Evansella halocellulosilytica]|uniref:MotE family protein n=1 Tax=Evansella halocellulosilytica TaxID=2011013 RepID=UPI000BB6959C|nr:hypothetical protein [Evansella halocellulosilytica]
MSENQKQSKLQLFFMVVLIPAIFAVVLAVVLLYYMGINVSDSVKSAFSALPFISDENDDELSDGSREERLVQLEHENENYLSQIEQLEYELAMKDEEISQLELEIQSYIENENNEEDQEEERPDLQEVVRTLEGMTASKAASIMSELSQDEAVMYLQLMSLDSRSQILARMDAEEAAQIVSQLSN